MRNHINYFIALCVVLVIMAVIAFLLGNFDFDSLSIFSFRFKLF